MFPPDLEQFGERRCNFSLFFVPTLRCPGDLKQFGECVGTNVTGFSYRRRFQCRYRGAFYGSGVYGAMLYDGNGCWGCYAVRWDAMLRVGCCAKECESVEKLL